MNKEVIYYNILVFVVVLSLTLGIMFNNGHLVNNAPVFCESYEQEVKVVNELFLFSVIKYGNGEEIEVYGEREVVMNSLRCK